MASWKDRRIGQSAPSASSAAAAAPRDEGASFTRRRRTGLEEEDGDLAEFKVVMVGTISVGKTSLACRYVKGAFREFVNATIGASYMWKRETIVVAPSSGSGPEQEEVQQCEVKFSLWDTAGQDGFHSLVPMYFREADAVVLVVDVTRASSLEEAAMWMEKVRASAPPRAVIYLALNKIDLDDRRVLLRPEAEQWCAQHRAGVAAVLCGDVSARTGAGVNEMFVEIGQACLRQRWAATAARGSHGGGEAEQQSCSRVVRLGADSNGGGGNKSGKCKC